MSTTFLLAPANAPFICEGPFFLTMQALCNLLMIDATNALRQMNSSHSTSSSNPAPEVRQIVTSKAPKYHYITPDRLDMGARPAQTPLSACERVRPCPPPPLARQALTASKSPERTFLDARATPQAGCASPRPSARPTLRRPGLVRGPSADVRARP